MPTENIYIFSKEGIDKSLNLDFELAPILRGYHTNKPIEMIKSLVTQVTKIGDWVLDPFGGSGVVLRACKELNRKCHTIDNSPESVEGYMLQIL